MTTQRLTVWLSLPDAGIIGVQCCTWPMSSFEHKAVANVTFMSTQPDAANAEGQAHGQYRLNVIQFPSLSITHSCMPGTLAEHIWSLLQVLWPTYALFVCLFPFVIMEGIYLYPQP